MPTILGRRPVKYITYVGANPLETPIPGPGDSGVI